MQHDMAAGMPDFRQARHPSRLYRGTCQDGENVVTVVDSALTPDAGGQRSLCLAASRAVKDCCDHFAWGATDAAELQLAIALLLDVSGDAATALKWYEHFARTYVRNLPDTWVVPELDIALWLYCFDNARPDS